MFDSLHREYKSKKTNTMKITLSGGVASGKSSVGKELARILNYDFFSVGERTRLVAASMQLNILDFQKLCKSDLSIDRKIDREFAIECNQRNNLVIDYRLGNKFINDAFDIFLSVSEKEAIKRLKRANRVNETFKTITARNKTVKEQFKLAYGEDFTSPGNYDLVLTTDLFKTPLQTAEFISNLLKNQ